MAKTGIGSTLTFSGLDDPFTARIRSITAPREFVEDLEDTGLDSTNYYRYCPDDLAELDLMEVEFYWNGYKPSIGDTATVTLTISGPTVSTHEGILVGEGYIKELQMPTLEAGTRKTGTLQVRFTGNSVVWTETGVIV